MGEHDASKQAAEGSKGLQGLHGLEGVEGLSLEDAGTPQPAATRKETKADRMARRAEAAAAAAAAAPADDHARDRYGVLPANPVRIEHGGMAWTEMRDLGAVALGSRVLVRGRWHQCRGTAKNAFILLRDGACMMQAVLTVDCPAVSRPMVKFANNLTKESVVDLEGELVPAELTSEALSYRGFELRVDRLVVVSAALLPPPFSLDDAARPEEDETQPDLPRVALDTRLNSRVVDLRTATNQAIFRLLGGAQRLFADYLEARGFTRIFTPKIISAASEGGANVFRVAYFKTEAFLAQSPQFYKQMAIAGGLGRVYEVAPVFRAENSFTHRHMTEFISMDMEMAIKSHYHEAMRMLADLVVFILRELPRRHAAESAAVKAQYPSPDFLIPEDRPVLVLQYPEAVALLRAHGVPMEAMEDLSTEKERRLGQIVRQVHGTDFFVLDKFPLANRAFYTMPDAEMPGYCNGYDFFVRGEEILSGAQRIHCPLLLTERIRAHGVDPATVEDYVAAFRHGAPPHAGGAIGLERLVMLFYDLKNIRKTSMFPRDPRRLTP